MRGRVQDHHSWEESREDRDVSDGSLHAVQDDGPTKHHVRPLRVVLRTGYENAVGLLGHEVESLRIVVSLSQTEATRVDSTSGKLMTHHGSKSKSSDHTRLAAE
jgi:hypothetical protein